MLVSTITSLPSDGSNQDDKCVARMDGLDLVEVDKLVVEYASDDLEPINHVNRTIITLPSR